MIKRFKNLIAENKRLFSDMFLVTSATVVSSFLSYYLNFYVQSKFIDVVDFANFSLFITFISLVSLIPSTLSTSIIMTVTQLKSEEKFQELFDLLIKLLGIFLLIAFIFFLMVSKFQENLNALFKVDLENFFFYAGLYLFVLILTVPLTGFIYGMMKFKSYSIVLIGVVLIKILGFGYFYSQGYGFNSIFYSFILSGFFAILFGIFALVSDLERPKIKISSKKLIGKVFLFSLPLLFISLGRDMITYIDFLVVKSKLDVLVSADYSLLINIGKIFLFGSLIVLGVMLPQIADSFNKKENYFNKFKIYLYLEGVIVLVGIICFGLFPRYIVDFLIYFSNFIGLNSSSFVSYYNIVDVLPAYSIFISLVVLINLFTIFLIAVQRFYIFIIYILSISIQFIGIYFYGTDILNVIICNIISASCLLGFLIYATYKQYESFNNNSSL